jgi:hypothetical protein
VYHNIGKENSGKIQQVQQESDGEEIKDEDRDEMQPYSAFVEESVTISDKSTSSMRLKRIRV